jgi:hypothetical protein
MEPDPSKRRSQLVSGVCGEETLLLNGISSRASSWFREVVTAPISSMSEYIGSGLSYPPNG